MYVTKNSEARAELQLLLASGAWPLQVAGHRYQNQRLLSRRVSTQDQHCLACTPQPSPGSSLISDTEVDSSLRPRIWFRVSLPMAQGYLSQRVRTKQSKTGLPVDQLLHSRVRPRVQSWSATHSLCDPRSLIFHLCKNQDSVRQGRCRSQL